MVAAGADADGGGPITVFLADDVPEMRGLLRWGLEEEPGFEVVGEAADGGGALEGVEAYAPTAILLDL